MIIQTADVNNLTCLLYNELHELIENDNYGIDCNNEVLFNEIYNVFLYLKYRCYSDNYITDYVLTNTSTLPTPCNRYSFEGTVPR